MISLSVDGQVIGLIAIQDAPKASSKEAIKSSRTGLENGSRAGG